MIYFIKSPEGPIKIGFTRELPVRLNQLRNVHGRGLSLLAVQDGNRPEETKLHHRFAHLRVAREWFTPGEDLLAYIQEHGKPWVRDQEYGGMKVLSVKMNRHLVWMARLIAADLDISVTEVLSEAARKNIDHEYLKLMERQRPGLLALARATE